MEFMSFMSEAVGFKRDGTVLLYIKHWIQSITGMILILLIRWNMVQ